MIEVVGYEGKYAVDEEGNVYSLNFRRSGKMQKLRPQKHWKGYLRVGLIKPGDRQRWFRVHRLVAQAYLPDYCEELQVDHIDRCKTNNCLSNLRMVTCAENLRNRE